MEASFSQMLVLFRGPPPPPDVASTASEEALYWVALIALGEFRDVVFLRAIDLSFQSAFAGAKCPD